LCILDLLFNLGLFKSDSVKRVMDCLLILSKFKLLFKELLSSPLMLGSFIPELLPELLLLVRLSK